MAGQAKLETGPAPAAPPGSARDAVLDLQRRVNLSIIGQERVVQRLVIALLANGNVLVEGLPGLAKTRAIKSLSKNLETEFSRIQFTPDLLPSDVTGGEVYRSDGQGGGSFEFRKGPIFGNLVLADEINRAPAKVQSALLEAMEERQVTVDATTYRLDSPFMVIATQNPVEHEGTYPLPESQLDRFLMRIRMGYPARRAEMAILDTHGGAMSAVDDLSPVASANDIVSMANLAQSVHVAPSLKGYIVDLAEATRKHRDLALGVSPRAALGLQRAARARAASLGREYVVPDDLKELAFPLLEHRLALTPEAQMRGVSRADALADAVGSVKVPTGRSS
jgi:MoxR-like ATPase